MLYARATVITSLVIPACMSMAHAASKSAYAVRRVAGEDGVSRLDHTSLSNALAPVMNFNFQQLIQKHQTWRRCVYIHQAVFFQHRKDVLAFGDQASMFHKTKLGRARAANL